MSTETDDASTFGISGTSGWFVGGTAGGAVGAAAFGLLMWLFDPAVVAVAIPEIYGLEPVGIAGWGVHIAHGIVLGLVFGWLVTRDPILGILRTDVETDILSQTGMTLRLVGAGFVFGLAVWALLPVLVLPVWAATIGGTAGGFPIAAIESLVGHLLFGVVLGVVFATTADLSEQPSGQPLED